MSGHVENFMAGQGSRTEKMGRSKLAPKPCVHILFKIILWVCLSVYCAFILPDEVLPMLNSFLYYSISREPVVGLVAPFNRHCRRVAQDLAKSSPSSSSFVRSSPDRLELPSSQRIYYCLRTVV